jgi:transcriptional regulator with XRE-family HTH domain
MQAATVAAMGKKSKPDIRERFGFAVKSRREELGLTQEDLAEKAQIHRTYLSDVERGTRNLSLVNIERLAAALSLSMSKLFGLVESR